MPSTASRTDLADDHPGGFAARLRAETWAGHSQAEGGGALVSLLDGSGDLLLYQVLLEQLVHVYAELEAAAEVMRADPIAGPFAAPELTRLPALHQDLLVLAGPDWAEHAVPLAATASYVDRLRTVATRSSGEFVAHHYTRYLGDLSGGFAVDAAVRRYLGLTGLDGRRFFQFDAIADPGAFKRNYRQLLDTAPWNAAERQQIAAETLLAYRLNTELQVAAEREAHRRRSASTA